MEKDKKGGNTMSEYTISFKEEDIISTDTIKELWVGFICDDERESFRLAVSITDRTYLPYPLPIEIDPNLTIGDKPKKRQWFVGYMYCPESFSELKQVYGNKVKIIMIKEF